MSKLISIIQEYLKSKYNFNVSNIQLDGVIVKKCQQIFPYFEMFHITSENFSLNSCLIFKGYYDFKV